MQTPVIRRNFHGEMIKKLMSVRGWGIITGLFILQACSGPVKNSQVTRERVICIADSLITEHLIPALSSKTEVAGKLEKKLREMGLVDIAELEPSIAVKIVYATPFNFVGEVLYKDLDKAFMLPETAEKLINAQKRLKTIRPDLNLIVYDAARPMSVQQDMWEIVKGTDKMIFVSNPDKGGGLHNYGAAVDVSLIDCTGTPLEMGSRYDYFGDEARPDREDEMLKQERITPRELDNRHLLRRVMTEAGFISLQSEWWHFNLISRQDAIDKLKVID